MTSLAVCIRKAGKALSDADRSLLTEIYQEKVAGGLKAAKAALEAIEEVIALHADERQSVITDIVRQGSLPLFPEESRFARFPDDVIEAMGRAYSMPPTILIKTKEREALRQKIAVELYGQGAKRQDREAHIVLGPPASGKSSVAAPLATATGSLIVDPDMAKERLPEFNGGIGARATHEESADIAARVLERAQVAGDNMVLPLVGKTLKKVEQKIDVLRDNGYTVYVHYVGLPIEKSVERAVERFRRTGRFVDPLYIEDEVRARPAENFGTIKLGGKADGYVEYSNDVQKGEAPKILDQSEELVAFSDAGLLRWTRPRRYRAGRLHRGVEAGEKAPESEGLSDELSGLEPEGAPGPAGGDGRRPLAETPAEALPEPQEGRNAGGGASQGRAGDAAGAGRPSGRGVAISRGMADREGATPAAAGGARRAGERAATKGTPDAARPSTSDLFGGGGVRTDGAGARAAGNYRITEADHLGAGGAKTKFRNNVAAIRLLKELTLHQRRATAAEQKVLVKYVGWGGIPQAFIKPDGTVTKGWEREAEELRALLTEDEYAAARRSTLDAHFTSRPVVNAIYSALDRFGLSGAVRILEPAMGTGHFFGLMPQKFQAATLHGVELDKITGGIAKLLYPKASISAPRGFQQADFPLNYFDVAVGNPPFGSQSIFDPKHPKISKFSIHNFFFAKSLETVRPGGLMAMVVSHNMLDSSNSSARQWLSERARLIGAIRLPNTAFKANAGTEVVTDIVFLQKLNPGEQGNAEAWVESVTWKETDEGPVKVNRYFHDHPDMILGDQSLAGTMYRQGEYTVEPTGDLEPALSEAIAKLPERVYAPREKSKDTANAKAAEAVDVPRRDVADTKIFGMFVGSDGKLHMRLPDVGDQAQSVEVEGLGEKQIARVRGMLRVRDVVRRLIAREMDAAASTKELRELRNRLNEVYDDFQAKHGYMHEEGNRRVMREDPEYPLLLSLERNFQKKITRQRARQLGTDPQPASADKAAIFTRRVIEPHRPVDRADTAGDALSVSLAEKGRVDMGYMAALTGKEQSALASELKGLIYKDPTSGNWMEADEYLSGNVKRKLAEAREAAKDDPRMSENVEALEEVQPADIDPVDISVRLNSPWVPGEVMADFFTHLLDAEHAQATYVPGVARWAIDIRGANYTKNATTWGTGRVHADELLDKLMNNKAIVVYDTQSDGSRSVNEEATVAAQAKAEEIKNEFQEWIWENADRRERVAKIYNDTLNTDVEARYDGAHLTFPGQVPDAVIKLNEHQANGAWRMIRDRRVLLDHAVGSGKTFTLIAGLMEMKRMGLVHKPMIAVPNHLVEQWASEFYMLYPAANILVTTKKDFEKKNRRQLFARIATGEYDAVIVAHSSFGFIPTNPDYEAAFYQQMYDEMAEAIEAYSEANGKNRTVKQMERTLESLETKIQSARDRRGKDDLLDFEELGVDALAVDEMHLFKNLFFATQRQRIAGLGTTNGSQRASDMFIKIRSLQDRNAIGGGNIFTATGTPISNTIAEMFTMQRYHDYDNLRDRGLHLFDAWADTFADSVTAWELDSTGVRYKLNTRMSRFVNLPELLALYRQFADSVSLADLKAAMEAMGRRWPVPKIKGGKPENVVVPRSEFQAAYMAEIVRRAEDMPSDPKEDNFLALTDSAKKAGLDMRLINEFAEDFEGSKPNEAVRRIVDIYNGWKKDKGTQLVFLDFSAPKGAMTKERERIATLIRKADEGDEAALEELSKFSRADIQAVQAKFSVYDDMKAKLVAKGIPEGEIAFIHEANTDKQKQELFDRVNAGAVRVLFGSTMKMGAGMNVQHRLVALHHMDAPWRPADLEQREGRIIRQGNELYARDPDNFEIEILRYATEKTYDARMWQTIEAKAGFIEQLRAGSVQREVEDLSTEAANAAEMKAAASGNPLILEQVELDSEVRKLSMLEKAHKRKQHDIEQRLRTLEGGGGPEARAKRGREEIGGLIRQRDKATPAKGYAVNGKVYEKRADAVAVIKKPLQKHFVGALKGSVKTWQKHFSYRGFPVETGIDSEGWTRISLKVGDGDLEIRHVWTGEFNGLKFDGLFTRMDNILGAFEEELSEVEQRKTDELKNIEELKKETGKPFDRADELKAKQARLAEVIALLQTESDRPAGAPEQREPMPAGHPGQVADSLRSLPRRILRSRPLDRPSFGRLSVSQVSDAADKVTIRWKGGVNPRVSVLANLAELPEDRLKAGLEGDEEAIYDEQGQVVYLIAGNLASLDRVPLVLAHEAAGHHVMEQIVPSWRRMRARVRELLDAGDKEAVSLREEALNRGYDEADADVFVREMLAIGVERQVKTGAVGRILRRLKRLVSRFLRSIGVTSPFAPNELAELAVTALRGLEGGIVRGGEQAPAGGPRMAAGEAPTYPAPFAPLDRGLYSRPPGEQVVRNQRGFMDGVRSGQPIDKVFRVLFQAVRVPRLTSAGYEAARRAIVDWRPDPQGPFSWLDTPIQKARAGLIDRYGLSEEYKRLDLKREARKRQVLMQAVDTVEKLRGEGVGMAEARALQAVLTGETIDDADWQHIAEPIRKAIDEMGQEAVSLGLISEETYQKNRGTYLHRVYKKHETAKSDLGRWVSNVVAGRRKRIVGNQFKGRGMELNPVTMSELLKNSPLNWWGRKLRRGKGDEALLKTKWRVFDRLSPVGEGTATLENIGRKDRRRRVLERVYVPADGPIPERYQAWADRGTWELRSFKGDRAVLWRDFTKAERESMGEILDARYTIAKTFQLMAHDLSTGRFLKEIAGNANWARKSEPVSWTEPRGRGATYTSDEWVKVPDTAVPGTKTKRWGALAGMYVRAEIWRDLNELNAMQNPGLWRSVMTVWKLNKTARNPVVHMNNIMSNLMFMDMADVRLSDLIRGLRSYVNKDEHYREAFEHGAFGAGFVENEIARDVLRPVLKELERENLEAEDTVINRYGTVGKIVEKLWGSVRRADEWAVETYRQEDELFRMATYMRRLSLGDSPDVAAAIARDQFLNYDIRAPWVNAARASFLPFIAYTYRAVPVIAKSLAERPWKLAKYTTLAYAANALAYLLAPGDEEDERKTMREQVQGHTWVGVPRMIRMPYRDDAGNPVFLDIRRWIPAGDVFDMNQSHSAVPIPAPLQFSGPLMLAAEFALNQQAFTGEPIVDELTDTPGEKAGKIVGWGWRSWMPSAPWIPGSWYWGKIERAITGGTDILGRDYSVGQAVASSVGIKLSPHDVELNRMFRLREIRSTQNEIRFDIRQLHRQRDRRLISQSKFEKDMALQRRKLDALSERALELME